MASPSSSKRRCLASASASASDASAGGGSLDRFLECALAMGDPFVPLGLSLERLLDSTPLPSAKESLLRSAARLASALTEAAARSSRKLASAHNSSAWPLPADLTLKVLSLLDTESLCFAAAACSLFSRCASHPLCYAHIDLTSASALAKLTNPVVSTLIQRAANALQSIKLGRLPHDLNTLDKFPLTGSCLAALTLDAGAAGSLLQKLHLYNLKMKDYNPCLALSACKSLRELNIVGIDRWSERILTTIIQHCHSIERLSLQVRGIYLSHVEDLAKNCPLLSSLALRGFGIKDSLLSALLKGARCLKYLDLSGSFLFSGSFLRNLGNDGGTNSLETLILRDCMNLRAKEVSRFLSAAVFGDWKALRYVDISNRNGLVVSFGSTRLHTRCAIEVSQVLQERPGIQLIANYPSEICFYGNYTALPSSSDSESPSSSTVSAFSASDTSSFSDEENSP